MRYFKLDENKDPQPATLEEYGAMLASNDKRVKHDIVAGHSVSTIFLGLDHGWGQDGPPILFETMVFNPDDQSDYQERCSTWDQALAMHETACEWVRKKPR